MQKWKEINEKIQNLQNLNFTCIEKTTINFVDWKNLTEIKLNSDWSKFTPMRIKVSCQFLNKVFSSHSKNIHIDILIIKFGVFRSLKVMKLLKMLNFCVNCPLAPLSLPFWHLRHNLSSFKCFLFEFLNSIIPFFRKKFKHFF